MTFMLIYPNAHCCFMHIINLCVPFNVMHNSSPYFKMYRIKDRSFSLTKHIQKYFTFMNSWIKMTEISIRMTTWRERADDVRDPEVNAQRCFRSISSAGFRQSSFAVVGFLCALSCRRLSASPPWTWRSPWSSMSPKWLRTADPGWRFCWWTEKRWESPGRIRYRPRCDLDQAGPAC